MAWRIDEAVICGEIDNTVEGHIVGRIWLVGQNEPLRLNLIGDCWRDLAGTRLRFENPNPKAIEDSAALELDQTGIVGDMTASRKNKVPTVSEDEVHRLLQADEEIPFEWRNTLYLEWFSEINGRVVIESPFFSMAISMHEWEMDDDAENAQKLANLNSMRDFMAQVIRRRDPSSNKNEDEDEDEMADEIDAVELDEYAWEERLKESDRLTDAYQEVLEKYIEDSDSEQKEAFVMGWDGLLEAMAERDESGGGDLFDDLPTYDQMVEHVFEYDENADEKEMLDPQEMAYGEDDEHPLQSQAQELAMRAMDLVQNDARPGSPSYELVTSLLLVSGKLAGALNGRNSGYAPQSGYVLAVLKRCLHWLNDAIGLCQELMSAEEDKDQLVALAHLRCSAFAIRDGITELRREMK